MCNNVDGPRGRERQIPDSITYMWNGKKGTNELLYKTEIDSLTDIENKLMVTKGRGEARRLGLT